MPESSEATAPESPRMRSKILNGLAWGAASQLALQLARIVVGVTLARLLAPDDYGVAAMVLVFSSLVLVFSDLGLGAALVQRPEITEDDRSTAFWATVAAGLVFTAAAALSAEPLARFYGEPAVADLCRAFSVVFLITSIGATQEALLVRAMKFKALELRYMLGTGVGATVGIAIAIHSPGPFAIIAQQLAEWDPLESTCRHASLSIL